MAKKRKKKKRSLKKPKGDIVPPTVQEPIQNAVPLIGTRRGRENSVLLQLAGNSQIVGALRWMLWGCLACGGFLTALFAFPDFGQLFVNITRGIASFIPAKMIPPGTYIPGVLTPFFLIILVAGFTIYGYLKGETPPKIATSGEIRSFEEKLFEFGFFLAVACVAVYFRIREDHPAIGLVDFFSDPFYLVFTVILLLGLLYFVFSRHQSQPFLFFILESAVACLFVLFLFGLMLNIVINFILHILNNWNSL